MIIDFLIICLFVGWFFVRPITFNECVVTHGSNLHRESRFSNGVKPYA